MTSQASQLLQLLVGRSFLHKPQNIDWIALHPLALSNAIAPWLYAEYNDLMSAAASELYRKDFIVCNLNRELLIAEAKRLEAQFPNQLVRIKGAALDSLIYSKPGQRVFYDIDLLVEKKTFDSVSQYLVADGFKKHLQSEWSGTLNRTNYTKHYSQNCEINFDLHQRLFWGVDASVDWEIEYDSQGQFRRLAHADHFFYLVVNWIYQDTFVGLYKLLDLILFWRTFSDQFSLERLVKLIKIHNLDRTFNLALQLMQKWGKVDTQKLSSQLDHTSNWIVDTLSEDFLVQPQSQRAKYFLLKHLTKPNIIKALRYDLGWMNAQIRNFF